MKKLASILLLFLGLFIIFMAPAVLSVGDTNGLAIAFIVIGVLIIVQSTRMNRNVNKEKFGQVLEMGHGKVSRGKLSMSIIPAEFNKDQIIKTSVIASDQYLAIDDTNKEFILSCQDGTFFLKFKDLVDFQLSDDGNQTVTGRGLQTAVGGLAFGVTGALIGATGKRRAKHNPKEYYYTLKFNSLKDNTATIKLLKGQEKTVDQIGSSLLYIMNNPE